MPVASCSRSTTSTGSTRRSFGSLSPRDRSHFVAKVEAHRRPRPRPADPQLPARSRVRRGESDREAVRQMREVVRDGHALGLFVEGTRQRHGRPGPGAARRGDGRRPGGRAGRAGRDLRLRTSGSPATSHPISVAWGEPIRFEGCPKGARATARRRPRSSAASTACTTGWPRCTRAAARGTRRRRDERPRPTPTRRSSAPSRSSASRTWASRR